MPKRKVRPGVDDDEWAHSKCFGALKRRATAMNFKSLGFKRELERRYDAKSLLVLERMLATLGEEKDAASAFNSNYFDQWSWSYVPMHLTFEKTANELREERATIACHNSTRRVIKTLIARKEKRA